MKILRITGWVLFILSAVTYLGYKKYEKSTSDTEGPVIQFTSDSIETSINAAKADLLQGVTAYDNKDGDVSDTLLIESISKFTNSRKRIITYAAFDSHKNITKRERELTYTDYVPPRFSMSKPLVFAIGDVANIIDGMTVLDCIDGDLTDKIRYEQPDITFGISSGIFPFEFRVTNSAGDTAYLPVEIEFYYPNAQGIDLVPQIHLSDYIIYKKEGDLIDPASYLKEISIGDKTYSFGTGQESGTGAGIAQIDINRVKISSDVNIKEPGFYKIVYSYQTENGYTGTTKLFVVVEE
jgi:hypothetical protein